MISRDDNALILSFWHHFCWMSHQQVFRSFGINLKWKGTKQITFKYVLLKSIWDYLSYVVFRIYKYLPQLPHESLQSSLTFPGGWFVPRQYFSSDQFSSHLLLHIVEYLRANVAQGVQKAGVLSEQTAIVMITEYKMKQLFFSSPQY